MTTQTKKIGPRRAPASTLPTKFKASLAKQEDAALELLRLTAALHPDARALAAAAKRSCVATGRLAALASLLSREHVRAQP